MSKVIDFIKEINETKLNEFLSKANTNIKIEKDVEKVISDTSWIKMVEDAIPYLDNIIRSPRRFIVQEENIIPIEKTKVVTEESIKHLAQNTGLIQSVDEKGNVIPLKLLNVYREETIDLYENRFIKSLIDNLYQFVENKLQESDQKSYAKINHKVSYIGQVNLNNEKVNVNLNLESDYKENVDESRDGHSLEVRIEHIKEVLAGFISSNFIRELKESSPVRSPIRKTNVILKEPNFIKALELWEYLENNNVKPITSVVKSHDLVKDDNIKNIYDTTFFINNFCLKEKEEKTKPEVSSYNISKLINEIVFSCNYNDNDVKQMISTELKQAIKKKQKILNNINNRYKCFIESYEKKKKKAWLILK